MTDPANREPRRPSAVRRRSDRRPLLPDHDRRRTAVRRQGRVRRAVRPAQYAADLGFDALWVRDVSTYWPEFDDAGQVYDPFVYLSKVAARTEDIALGTPNVAKTAASVDRLSDGRLVLGVASGGRPPEYAAFGVSEAARGERFRESVRVLRAAREEPFPERETSFGRLTGDLDVVPKPATGTPAARDGPLAADPTAEVTPIHRGFAAGGDWFRERLRALDEFARRVVAEA